MTEKNIFTSGQLNKRDLDLIIEVNKKAIEIETVVGDQNEEIIDLLNRCKTSQEKIIDHMDDIEDGMDEIEEKIDKIKENTETIHKDIFKIQVLFVTGLLSLVVQVIQMFIKK